MKMSKKDVHKVSPALMERLNLNAAGIDIGSEELFVCVEADRDQQPIRKFGVFTADLREMATWLVKCQIDTVAMEATGVYWIPIFDMLESVGIQVYLVNATHLKNVDGRKSDMIDCAWLQQLHTVGLLRPSFVPDSDIRAIREISRHRDCLVRSRVTHIQRMQKALDQMNLKLHKVISDITGVTGLNIIRAIINGESNPAVLARFRDVRCKSSEDEISKALDGNFRREHLFTLTQNLSLFDLFTEQLLASDRELNLILTSTNHALDQPSSVFQSTPPDPNDKYWRTRPTDFSLASQLYQFTGTDLTQIEGIQAQTAQTIISEIGTDMSCWPSHKHFCSWLGVSPNNKVTGGKVKSSRTRKTNNRANTALRIAAQSLASSNTSSGAFYRRKRSQFGPAVATVATAHRLARVIYYMLKNHSDYNPISSDQSDKLHQDRKRRYLQHQAESLGFDLVPSSA